MKLTTSPTQLSSLLITTLALALSVVALVHHTSRPSGPASPHFFFFNNVQAQPQIENAPQTDAPNQDVSQSKLDDHRALRSPSFSLPSVRRHVVAITTNFAPPIRKARIKRKGNL